jgi:hypothetical protein
LGVVTYRRSVGKLLQERLLDPAENLPHDLLADAELELACDLGHRRRLVRERHQDRKPGRIGEGFQGVRYIFRGVAPVCVASLRLRGLADRLDSRGVQERLRPSA